MLQFIVINHFEKEIELPLDTAGPPGPREKPPV
jgi:hypothetical protein